ncbi:MAG: Ig-like domain-containing protein [Breznakibacter sp.]
MNIVRNIWAGLLIFASVTACEQGIDSISHVAPGNDESVPVITVSAPTAGYEIKVPNLEATVSVSMEVTDDIELQSVTLSLDGTVVKTYSAFRDYRRLVVDTVIGGIVNGDHTLTIKATDLDGKSTTSNVAFSKVSPYTKQFDGEMFYMPFDGDLMEMISFQYATKVGSPTFADGGILGSKAYAGATDGYLTFPLDGLGTPEFSAAFWCKINASPDRAGVLNVSPAGEDRTKGFRIFREGGASLQRFKLNVGTGTGETWNDGGELDATTGEWVHLAFTISGTKCAIYFNGALIREVDNTGIDWTGCTLLSIGSGMPNFAYWDHKSDLSQYDELRLFDKALSASEIQAIIAHDSPYVPKYTGEVFYMPFDGNNKELVSNTEASKVGSPSFASGKKGQAYVGAADSYLTFPADGLKGGAFSAVFWTRVNATPDRAGILVMGPPDVENAGYPATQNLRTSGFRFFRENASGMQRFKLNVGDGTADTWVDGGASADVDPSAGEWEHMAFTVSGTRAVVYINGEIAKEVSIAGIDWTGCDLLSIMSGAPRFTEWNHLSDLGMMDELRIFNKELSQAEVQAIMADEQ